MRRACRQRVAALVLRRKPAAPLLGFDLGPATAAAEQRKRIRLVVTVASELHQYASNLVKLSVLPSIITAKLSRSLAAFNDPEWLFELKHDGFRSLAYIEDGKCRLVPPSQHL